MCGAAVPPIGMKKQFVTVVDESSLAFSTIIFSGGKIGVQVELAPADLLALTGAKTAPVTEAGFESPRPHGFTWERRKEEAA